jgi:hypothetical protein
MIGSASSLRPVDRARRPFHKLSSRETRAHCRQTSEITHRIWSAGSWIKIEGRMSAERSGCVVKGDWVSIGAWSFLVDPRTLNTSDTSIDPTSGIQSVSFKTSKGAGGLFLAFRGKHVEFGVRVSVDLSLQTRLKRR